MTYGIASHTGRGSTALTARQGAGAVLRTSLLTRLITVAALVVALAVAALSHEGVMDLLARPVVLAAVVLCLVGVAMPSRDN